MLKSSKSNHFYKLEIKYILRPKQTIYDFASCIIVGIVIQTNTHSE